MKYQLTSREQFNIRNELFGGSFETKYDRYIEGFGCDLYNNSKIYFLIQFDPIIWRTAHLRMMTGR